MASNTSNKRRKVNNRTPSAAMRGGAGSVNTNAGSGTVSPSSHAGSDSASSQAPSVAVNPSASASGSSRKPKPRNFSKVEDELLCRAYVNATTNSVCGTDQKLKDFWKDIKSKFDALCVSEQVEEDREERNWEALHVRYTKKIQPQVLLFNPFYKRIADCPPSGTTKDDWPRLAANEFSKAKDSDFKFLHCVPILHQLAKFDPMTDDDQVIDMTEDDDPTTTLLDDDDGGGGKPKAMPTTNKIGKPMGSSLSRPIGQKQAKRLAKEESSKLDAMDRMTLVHSQVQKEIATANKLEVMKGEFMILKEMGDMEGCAQLLAEYRAMKASSAENPSAEIPPNSASSAENLSSELEEQEEDGGNSCTSLE